MLNPTTISTIIAVVTLLVAGAVAYGALTTSVSEHGDRLTEIEAKLDSVMMAK